MRFQFVIAVWGDKYIDQMCAVCLPCMLAPNNLPAIPVSERLRVLFVTRASDVPRLKSEPMVQRIQELIAVEFLEFDPTANTSTHLALSAAHRKALEMAARDSALFVLLAPDVIFSNGTFASVRRVIATGKSVVMVSGLRLSLETAMPVLQDLRLSESYADNRLLEPRNLMKFAMEHFHPEVARYHFDSPKFTAHPLVCLWRVRDEGLLDRSFHLHPFVYDMREFDRKAMATLDHDTIDGAFTFHAFRDRSKIYVEKDSDSMLIFSFSSINECIEPMRENRASVELLRRTAYLFNVNAFHRSLFNHAIKLHTGDLNEAWNEVEKSTATLSRHFKRPPRKPKLPKWLFRLFARRPRTWEEYQDRGIKLDAAGNYLGAAVDYALAISIGPPNPALHCLRGVALLNATDMQGAAAEFEAGLKLDPTNATLRGLLDQARQAPRARSVSVTPSLWLQFKVLRALLLHLFSRLKQATRYARTWEEYQARGIKRDAMGDYTGAALDYALAIRVGPPNPTLHCLRGVALLNAADHRAAAAEFEAGLKLDPNNAVLRNMLEQASYTPQRLRASSLRFGLLQNKTFRFVLRILGIEAIYYRFKLLNLVVATSWKNRKIVKERLKDCFHSQKARARVWWRVRQIFTLIVFRRIKPEFPNSV